MSKSLSKNEKLDLILYELAKLRSEMRKHHKRFGADTGVNVKGESKPERAALPKKANRSNVPAPQAKAVPSSKPVLVEATTRTAS